MAVAPEGGELVRMLRGFHGAVTTGALPPIAGAAAVAVMRLTTAAIDALIAAGAPIERSTAPRHAASPELAARYR